MDEEKKIRDIRDLVEYVEKIREELEKHGVDLDELPDEFKVLFVLSLVVNEAVKVGVNATKELITFFISDEFVTRLIQNIQKIWEMNVPEDVKRVIIEQYLHTLGLTPRKLLSELKKLHAKSRMREVTRD